MTGYATVIHLCWLTFFVVWIVGAINVKRDLKGGRLYRRFGLLRAAFATLVVISAFRLLGRASEPGFPVGDSGTLFGPTAFTPPETIGWLAAALAVVGVAFAIWARVYLGRNWSAVPSVKEGHELVTNGPYAYVRHPIYTGILLLTFGSALGGSVLGTVLLMLGCVAFLARIDKEENIMLELFPSEYPEYQAHTKRLVPFLW